MVSRWNPLTNGNDKQRRLEEAVTRKRELVVEALSSAEALTAPELAEVPRALGGYR